MRHAFDADHIAAIDNTTRRLAERGRPATTVGFWFSLGHSTIVVVLCILLTLGITAIGSSLADDSSALRTWTGVIGPSVSGVFLLVIAAINIASLRRRHGHAGGPVLRMLGPFEKAVDRPSRMYIVGLLFGLGFDTATEIGLLTLAGAAYARGGALVGGAHPAHPVRRRDERLRHHPGRGDASRLHLAARSPALGEVYAIAMTGLSVVAAVLIAIVQLAGVLVSGSASAVPCPGWHRSGSTSSGSC